MSKSHRYFSSFLFLILTILGVQCSSLGTISNAFASHDGNVQIWKDEFGFYVDVDYTADKKSSFEAGKFMLSLFNFMTLIASPGCLGFNNYYCSQHNCKYDGMYLDYFSPYFKANGRRASIEAHLDHPSWSLKTNAQLADFQCFSDHKNIGYGRDGILGMSREKGSSANYHFVNSDGFVFAISMKNDLSGGVLTFSKNQSRILANPITLQIKDGSQWKLAPTSCSLSIEGSTYKMKASLMFDIHAEVIALPAALYDHIIQSFNKAPYSCSSDKSKPVCSSSENILIKNLPILVFEIQGQKISIPSSVYTHEANETQINQFTLHIKAIDPSFTGENNILDDFKGTIIFDSSVMSHFYAVFYQNKIELHGQGGPTTPSKPTDSSQSQSPPLYLALLLILFVVVVSAVIRMLISRSRKKAELGRLQAEQNPFIQGSEIPRKKNNELPQY